VLARAYAPSYPHGAKYWLRLQAIAERGVDLAASSAAYIGHRRT
jgi:hypothetical protein